MFNTGIPGPKFLILGAVHGSEPAGYIAINRLIDNLDSGEIELKKGSLTLIPCCNPPAFAAGERQINRNLNRDMRRYDDPQCYEDLLSNALCPLLEECDYLLDVHSYSSGGPPFLSINPPDAENIAFAEALGPKYAIYGWDDAFTSDNPEQKAYAKGTKNYAMDFGAVGATVECGQNEDPESPNRGYQYILNALHYLGMADLANRPQSSNKLHYIKMTKIHYKEKAGIISSNRGHLDFIKKSEVILEYEDGDVIIAEEDSYAIMPKTWAEIGGEWIYLGVEGKP